MSRFPNNFQSPNRHFRPWFQGNDCNFAPPPWEVPGPHCRPSFRPPRAAFFGPRNGGMPHGHRPEFGGPTPRYRHPSPIGFAEFPPMHGPRPHMHHAHPPNANRFGSPNTLHRHPNLPQPPSSPQIFKGQGPMHRSNNYNDHNHNSKPKQQGDKRRKKAKPPKEVDYSHYCDVCDRGFKSDEQLKTHIAEHVKCKEKDCRFAGHPKVVKLHSKLQHGPGAKKIRWLDTPEEIQRWRNERKRNFPTAENVVKKKAEMEKRRTQGNVLETKQFGKMKGGDKSQRGGRRGRGRGHARQSGNRHPVNGHHEVLDASSDNQESPAKRRKTEDSGQASEPKQNGGEEADQTPMKETKPIDPVLPKPEARAPEDQMLPKTIPSDCDPLSILAVNGNDSDEEGSAPNAGRLSPAIEVAPKGSFGALGSLATAYDTDSEESDSENVQHNAEEKTTTLPNETHAQPDPTPESGEKSTSRESLGDGVINGIENGAENGESLSMAGSNVENAKVNVDSRRRGWRGKKGKAGKARNGFRKNEPAKRKATLLEMLLAPEIRRERNIILQCVRHIVKKNFFQESAAGT